MEGSEHYKPGVEVGGGRFKIIKKLGEGGMGVVCLAEDSLLKETVAVKFLSPQLGHDEEAMEDMMRETRKSRQLSHRNIVRIHDIYHLPGEAPFITMEFIEGQPLSSLKAEQLDRFFPWPYIEPLVAQMCDALDYAHEEKIVHRDLKPANIMIDDKGRVKLADFGLAATISDSMVKVSKDMGVSGTPSYMGPQQLAGKPSKETDDIYSLGATIYELLTSKPPFFKGDVLHQIREEIPLTVEERLGELGLDNDVPAAVSQTIAACLEKDPAKRPQSAGEVAELMGCAPPSMSRRSIRGNANAAVALDSPEATQMLSRLGMEEAPAETPAEKPTFNFVDPPKSVSTGPTSAPPAIEQPAPPAEPAFEPETIPPDQPLPEEYSPADPEPAEEYAAEPEYEEEYADETAATGKGKLYAIIGSAAAVLIAGLAFIFSGGGDDAAPDSPPNSPSVASTGNPPPLEAKTLSTYGFRSLLDPEVLQRTAVAQLSGNIGGMEIESESPFSESDFCRLDASQRILVAQTHKGDKIPIRLSYHGETLSGFEFGIAFSVEGAGSGPQFQFHVPTAKPVSGFYLGFKAKDGGLARISSGLTGIDLGPATDAIPDSLAALYEDLTRSGPVTDDITDNYFLAVRCDGRLLQMRDSTMTEWQQATIDQATSENYAVGAIHRLAFTGNPNTGRTLKISRHYLRSLKKAKLASVSEPAGTVVFENALADLDGFERQQSANEENFEIDTGSIRIIGESGTQARYGVRKLSENLKPGRHYRLTIEMKTSGIEKSRPEGSTGASAGLIWKVAAKMDSSFVFAPTGSADWQTKTMLFQIPEGAVAPRLALRLNASAGTVWFRQVKIEELPE